MKNELYLLLLLPIVFVAGCGQKLPEISSPYQPANQAAYQSLEYAIPNEISNLRTLDEIPIDTPEKYIEFANRANDAIDILEEKTDFKIPRLKATREGYDEVSKVITEYTPLIKSYNRLILSARGATDKKDDASLGEFYKSAGIFGAEFGIIYAGVFYKFSYQSVGTIYRASGFQTLALKCGSCVSVVLTEAHWALRGALVEGSSKIVETLVNITQFVQEKNIAIESVQNNFNQFASNFAQELNNLNINISLVIPKK